MIAKSVRGLALGAVGIALALSCQSTPATTGGAQACVLGETIACVPDGGSHELCTRTCLPDLSDYGPCLCGGDAGKKDAH